MTKSQLKRRLKSISYIFHRIGLKNRRFSIMSNNCWSGAVYDYFHLPYQTPTIGLWMTAEDYLRFLGDLDFYFSEELVQISWREFHAKEILEERKRRGKYTFDLDDLIIGRLHDVDIVFLHYNSFEEAKKKWNYRKLRLDRKNLLVKFNDQNSFKLEYYTQFCELPFKNKLFITAHAELEGTPYTVFIDEPEWDGSIKDDTVLKLMPFSIKRLLNAIGDNYKIDEFISGDTYPPN